MRSRFFKEHPPPLSASLSVPVPSLRRTEHTAAAHRSKPTSDAIRRQQSQQPLKFTAPQGRQKQPLLRPQMRRQKSRCAAERGGFKLKLNVQHVDRPNRVT